MKPNEVWKKRLIHVKEVLVHVLDFIIMCLKTRSKKI